MTRLDDPFARKPGIETSPPEKVAPSGDAEPKPAGSRGAGPAVVVVVVLFILLPLLYVFAIGPIIWLNTRKIIDVTPDSTIAWIYAPLEYAHSKSKIVSVPLDWYLELWYQPDPPVAAPAAPYMPPPTAAPVPAPPPAATGAAVSPGNGAAPSAGPDPSNGTSGSAGESIR